MSRVKVLIVDDDVRLSMVMKAGLESTGPYEVRVENNPRHARSVALEFRPDILILDVIMPEKDGGVVASEIRADPNLKDTPVIFVTSIVGKEEARAMGGHTGADPVLAKPITLADLTRQIQESLGMKR